MAVKEDTIVARATAPGTGAIAIIRLSGDKAIDIVDECFSPTGKISLANSQTHHLLHGVFIDPISHENIDEVLAVRMSAPHSYTGEDMVEIYCHGGTAIARRILDLLQGLGARLAEPGEFTRRAFLNDRIDLVQAEAVADLVAATTEQARQIALRQLRGALSSQISEIRELVLDTGAVIEAHIDFPEEDITPADKDMLCTRIREASNDLEKLITGGERGRLIREGARVIIAGRPNTGKSSLFNALLRKERAIVTPHPGTTRDTIESTIDLNGIPLTLVDTAGIRAARDEIEAIGIKRTEDEIRNADMIVMILDASEALQPEDIHLWNMVSKQEPLVVLNKIDLPAVIDKFSMCIAFPDLPDKGSIIEVSAQKNINIDNLEAKLLEHIGSTDITGEEGILISNMRHITALKESRDALYRVMDALEKDISYELVMIDIYAALAPLGRILGLEIGDEILDRIFSRFCIGK